MENTLFFAANERAIHKTKQQIQYFVHKLHLTKWCATYAFEAKHMYLKYLNTYFSKPKYIGGPILASLPMKIRAATY